jgi:hypothetical protein
MKHALTAAFDAVPISLVKPYLAGGLFLEHLVRGRFHLAPKDAETLDPENLSALTASSPALQNPRSEGFLAPGAAAASTAETEADQAAFSSQKEMKAKHE